MTHKDPVITAIGEENFRWLAKKFNQNTRLGDIPEGIIDRVASVDITTRNYAGDANSILTIALITFAYKMANKMQMASQGGKDILLVKALVRKEKLRRGGKQVAEDKFMDLPVFELITGEVGDRVRRMPTMNSPTDTHG